ncbi:MAG: hypothetical protein AAF850_06295 [Pseudomonadota bacterium]
MAELRSRTFSDPGFWFLAGVYALGLAHIAILPPFEGFDETAHFSSVQLVADEGRWPVFGRDKISREIETYRAFAPMRYASTPPFDENGGATYAAALSTASGREQTNQSAKTPPDRPRVFVAGDTPNWQAQHPPLAYIALAPVYAMTKHLALLTQLFWLRAACWSIAVIGLIVGMRSIASFAGPRAALAVAAWPLGAPMFFPEMARLGNDAFCVLFVSLTFAAGVKLLAAIKTRDNPMVSAMLLGVALGAGGLTKAFFLPMAVGVLAFLTLAVLTEHFRNQHKSGAAVLRMLAPIAVAGGVFFLVAGWWYVGKLIDTGSLTGSNDMISAQGAAMTYFSLKAYFIRIASIVLSFAWTGTWSLVKLPYLAVAIYAGVLLVVFAACFFGIAKQRRMIGEEVLAISIVAPVFVGLAYHAFVQTALGPAGIGTPGYYLHIFAAPLAFLVYQGVSILKERLAGRLFLGLGAGYLLVFTSVAILYQINMFAGCAEKTGDNRFYQPTACFNNPEELWVRLNALTLPTTAVVTFLAGAGCVIFGAYRLRQDTQARRARSVA